MVHWSRLYHVYRPLSEYSGFTWYYLTGDIIRGRVLSAAQQGRQGVVWEEAPKSTLSVTNQFLWSTEWIFSRLLQSHFPWCKRNAQKGVHLQGAGVCVVVLAKRSDISLSFSWSLFWEASINSSCASSLGMSGKKSRWMISVSACCMCCVCVVMWGGGVWWPV